MPLYQNKQPSKNRQNNVSYQPLNSNFEAIQQLKEADRQVDLMKRRISALKVKEEKNNSQTQLALKKLKYHKLIQQMQNKRKIQNEAYRNEVQSRIQRQRALNSSERSQRKKKLVYAKIQLQQIRSKSFIAQKMVSKQINNRLKQLNQSQYLSRKQIRDNVRKSQNLSQKNYDIFCRQRKSSVRYYRDQQQSRIIDLKQKRQYQMRELARIQIQLLERQSRSRQNAQKSIKQLASHYKSSNKRQPSTELSRSQSFNPQNDLR